jgi:hypothetical protein
LSVGSREKAEAKNKEKEKDNAESQWSVEIQEKEGRQASTPVLQK